MNNEPLQDIDMVSDDTKDSLQNLPTESVMTSTVSGESFSQNQSHLQSQQIQQSPHFRTHIQNQAPTQLPSVPQQPQPQQNIAQKSQKLQEFLKNLEDYKPTVPDALTKNYMHTAGFDSNDPRFVRLVSILGQKFIADITNDALQHYKMRNAQPQHKRQNAKDKKYVLAYEDLAPVLAEYGIDAKKPHYFF